MITVILSILILGGVSFGYLSVYYHADSSVEMKVTDVEIKKIDGGYLFDGPGEDTALIFYPGAKVDSLAYARLLTLVSEEGVDCFLADMPFHMAMMGANTADKFMKDYSYEHWNAAGHSLGGLVVSGYVSKHLEMFDSLSLLAAYPGGEIPENIRFCSIYGTQDRCLNKKSYEEGISYWPENFKEYVIDGGNHAQYADYGPQSGDGESFISPEEQQTLTAKYLLNTIFGKNS